jgi:hypothetical protein
MAMRSTARWAQCWCDVRQAACHGAVVWCVVAVLLGVLFASLGVLMVGGVALGPVCIGGIATAAAAADPIGIYYYVRKRQQRRQHLALNQAV